jgi:endonuclease/exonuclease/phosphatase family metal-dependent hydrolase
LLVIGFLLFWLLVRPIWSVISLVALILGWKNVSAVIPLGLFPDRTITKEEGTVRILSWNVRRFVRGDTDFFDPAFDFPEVGMIKVIKELNPEIICFQEFSTSEHPDHANNLRYFVRRMGYPHYVFSHDRTTAKKFISGTAIFSRKPILKTGRYPFPHEWGSGAESLIFADILAPNQRDTLRVYNAHLQSYGFMRRDYKDLSIIKNQDDSALQASKRLVNKMWSAFSNRGRQADFVARYLSESPYPEIFCGDLNDVPNSYSYLTVKNNRNDAFLERGAGLGPTYRSFSSPLMRSLPILRIDYILLNKKLEVEKFLNQYYPVSDHHVLVADIRLREK